MSIPWLCTERRDIVRAWKTYKGWVMTGLFLLQLIVVYGLIQLYVDSGVVPITTWDRFVPMIPVFLVPYCLYYLILPLPFVAAYRKDKASKSRDNLFVVGATFFVASTICNAIFILFPTEILRPPVVGSGVFAQLLDFLHTHDGTVALLPSGHVTYSLTAALTVTHLDRKLAKAVWPAALFVLPSTVLIKQHYIVDILGGIIVALLVYLVVFLPLWKRLKTHLSVEGDTA